MKILANDGLSESANSVFTSVSPRAEVDLLSEIELRYNPKPIIVPAPSSQDESIISTSAQ